MPAVVLSASTARSLAPTSSSPATLPTSRLIWGARSRWERRCRDDGAKQHLSVKNMKKAVSEPIDIPGLDVAKAKRYSRTKLAVLLLSTLWSVARLVWFASDRRAARLNASITRGLPDRR